MATDPPGLIELYLQQRLSLARIGARYGHSADWVRARLVAAGVPLRAAGRQARINDNQVRALLDQGLRVSEIADRLGVTESPVLDRMRARGWTGPPRRPRGPSRNTPPPAPVETLRQLYLVEGLSVAEVAHRLGVTKHRVIAELQAAGVPGRRPGWTNGQPPAPITRAQLTELYLDGGMTVGEVAAALHTTTTRVNAALRRHGIDRRPEPATPPPPLDLDRTTLTELYVTRRLDDAAIGALHGVPPYRVTQRRRELGVRRASVAPPHPEPPGTPAPAQLHRWYLTEGQTLEQIARRQHTTRERVKQWLQAAGVSVQPRTTRETRKQLDPELLRELYVDREWTATQIALELDTSPNQVLRTLHEHDIPVRRGGPLRPRMNTPSQQRLAALYDDPDVAALLRRHDIPVQTEGGTITQRFSEPAEISTAFLIEAYTDIGLSAAHIEHLTGQSAERVLALLREHGVPVRPSGPSSPWLRRQRPFS